MPIYTYETIPKKASEKPIRYEIKQSMTEDALSKHPETGQRIRRVITGGFFTSSSKSGSSSHGKCCSNNSCCG
ncbi:MAG: zinc ribbon domain-containing protein [Verrucomicrobiota bacterium]